MFFISNAYANGAASTDGGMLQLLIIFAIFGSMFYLFMYRPNAKKNKERKNLLDSIAKGDEILIAGGLMGKIEKLNDLYAVIALNDNTQVSIKRDYIVAVLPKGTLKSI